MKVALFLDIIGRDRTFSEHGFQVSGVRFQAGFSIFTLTPDTRHLKPEYQCPIFMQSLDSQGITAIFTSLMMRPVLPNLDNI